MSLGICIFFALMGPLLPCLCQCNIQVYSRNSEPIWSLCNSFGFCPSSPPLCKCCLTYAMIFYCVQDATNTCHIIWCDKTNDRDIQLHCVLSVNVLCSRAPTASRGQARFTKIVLTKLYICPLHKYIFNYRGSADHKHIQHN